MNYKTIKEYSEALLIEKKSRFLGYCLPVQTEDEAIAFINSIKEKHKEASHNVYAYNLRENNKQRFSDAGEPQGTAGIPILDLIKKECLTDICVVVTRYFGGTLLGTGGLVRAYSQTASLAIKKSHIITMRLCDIIRLECDYTFYDRVNTELLKNGAKIINSDFLDSVIITFAVKKEDTKQLTDNLLNITNGNAQIKATEEKYFN